MSFYNEKIAEQIYDNRALDRNGSNYTSIS